MSDVIRPQPAPYPLLGELEKDNKNLRRLLGVRSGLHLYTDDGEVQGQYKHVHIDFLRDPVSTIATKLQQADLMRFNELTPNLGNS